MGFKNISIISTKKISAEHRLVLWLFGVFYTKNYVNIVFSNVFLYLTQLSH